jgi:hypothetical protein
MSTEPYRKAQRVFLVIDNGSAHRGQRSIDRLQGTWPNLIPVHTPVHASWLNQGEIYFSVVQRKVVTPNDFADLDTLKAQLLAVVSALYSARLGKALVRIRRALGRLLRTRVVSLPAQRLPQEVHVTAMPGGGAVVRWEVDGSPSLQLSGLCFG